MGQPNMMSGHPQMQDHMASYGAYSTYIPQNSGLYAEAQPPQIAVTHHPFQDSFFESVPPQPLATGDSGVFIDPEQSTPGDLSDALGELKIDETGIGKIRKPTPITLLLTALLAPNIRPQRQGPTEPEAPIQEEGDDELPPLKTGAGSTIRIPPELMPSNEEAVRYFKIFFSDIHPYVPVVHRVHMYQQWRNDRSSISPLLLEALFACAGRMSDDPAEGAQWLALANREFVPISEPAFAV
jgi:hypothetical protein